MKYQIISLAILISSYSYAADASRPSGSDLHVAKFKRKVNNYMFHLTVANEYCSTVRQKLLNQRPLTAAEQATVAKEQFTHAHEYLELAEEAYQCLTEKEQREMVSFFKETLSSRILFFSYEDAYKSNIEQLQKTIAPFDLPQSLNQIDTSK